MAPANEANTSSQPQEQPTIEDALRALDYWQSLDRFYAPVRELANPQAQIGFSVNSTPMLNSTMTK